MNSNDAINSSFIPTTNYLRTRAAKLPAGTPNYPPITSIEFHYFCRIPEFSFFSLPFFSSKDSFNLWLFPWLLFSFFLSEYSNAEFLDCWGSLFHEEAVVTLFALSTYYYIYVLTMFVIFPGRRSKSTHKWAQVKHFDCHVSFMLRGHWWPERLNFLQL